MRGLIETEVPMPLGQQYRRCAAGMARLETAVGMGLEQPRATHAVDMAGKQVLAGLREATAVVLDSLAGTERGTPVARFLACRLDRLAIAADAVVTAAAVNDVAALRRSAVRFRALAAAMWKVQLAVCGSSLTPGRSTLDRSLPVRCDGDVRNWEK